MSIKTYGLKKVSIAAPMADGSMATDLTEFCQTYRDSCEFIEDDPQINDEFSDQEDDPIATFVVKGSKSIKFSTFDYSPSLLVKLKGGTVVNGKWAEPPIMPEIFVAVELLTNTDYAFHFPKCRAIAKFNTKLIKNGLSLLEVTLRPQAPGHGRPAVLIGQK